MKNNLITIANFFIIISLLIIVMFIPFYIELNIDMPQVINTCNKIEINKPLNKDLVSNFYFLFNEDEPIQKNQYLKSYTIFRISCDLEIKNNIVISKKLSFF